MNSTTFSFRRRAPLAVATIQLGGLVLLATTFTGCIRRPIVVQAPPATVIQSPPTVVNNPAPAALPPTGRDVIIIKEAPPPPRDETPPPPPSSSGYSWLPGYWTSRDGRQEWVSGRWATPPRTGATWVSPRWDRTADGYVFVEGYWR